MLATPRAVYVHVPFCRHRCGYCNFTVVAGRNDLQDKYLEALRREMTQPGLASDVDTLYIGGGTPTELDDRSLEELCRLLREWFPPCGHYEWSIEANPYDLDRHKVRVLSSWGVNRISLGIQSFDTGKLELLERDHREEEALAAYALVREFFPTVSIDLIFGVPGESLKRWQHDLEVAMDLEPDHISIYGLTFEKGTTFWGRMLRSVLEPLNEETQRAMYEVAIDSLIAAGWEHYEVSNFARPGHRCRHNEVYWTGDPYFAFGAGASRYVDGRRETNHRSTTTYIRRVLRGQSPVAESETLSLEDRARELLVFHLRMLEGISRGEFQRRTGVELDELVGGPLRKFIARGLLEQRGDRIRLTREGLMISDALWPEFL